MFLSTFDLYFKRFPESANSFRFLNSNYLSDFWSWSQLNLNFDWITKLLLSFRLSEATQQHIESNQISSQLFELKTGISKFLNFGSILAISALFDWVPSSNNTPMRWQRASQIFFLRLSKILFLQMNQIWRLSTVARTLDGDVNIENWIVHTSAFLILFMVGLIWAPEPLEGR